MIYISPSMLESWRCRERFRQNCLLGAPAHPNIFMAFGSCIHRMAFGYWEGWDYDKTYSFALLPALQDHTREYWQEKFGANAYTDVVTPFAIASRNPFVDVTQLTQKEVGKWNERLDSLAALTTLYFSRHGEEHIDLPAFANEKMIQFRADAGEQVVMATGIMDRISNNTLCDTKTVTAVNRDWKQQEKLANLRKPQLHFYLRWCDLNNVPIERVIIQAVVRPYRGSEPDIVELDLTDEVFAQRERFKQQMNWAMLEIVGYLNPVCQAQPWPMNQDLCSHKYGECDYAPICDMRVSGDKFVRINATANLSA